MSMWEAIYDQSLHGLRTLEISKAFPEELKFLTYRVPHNPQIYE